MVLMVLTYLAGILTIASPCILPILPFILTQIDRPFWRNGLPMLGGMALAFALAASLAAFAGHWAIGLNQFGRACALLLVAVFGLTLLFPILAARLSAPFVALGESLSRKVGGQAAASGARIRLPILLGVATGLLWTPCAGPLLGLILTKAAFGGPSLSTLLLLLLYASGAATALAAVILFGNRLLAAMENSLRLGAGIRRALGVGVMIGAVAIAGDLDVGLLTRISSSGGATIEQAMARLAAPANLPTAGNATTEAATPLFGATQWLNSAPLLPENVKGKVVLVNFWTYSCINCLRMLPYVRAWAEKYQDRGLVVIGAHTPEFAFEKDIANVAKAVAALGVNYPVAIDNDFEIWRAFNNRAWPALYFIDANGRLRDHVLGEGGYAESEKLILQLLAEANGVSLASEVAITKGQGTQAPADLSNLESGEGYIGYDRAQNFAAPGGMHEGVPHQYHAVAALPLNYWSLDGLWTVGREFATLNNSFGRIVYRFHARDLHLVMAPPTDGRPIRFRVKIDNAAPGADHGVDVDADGWGTVQEGRLYQLIRQSGVVGDRIFEVEFSDAGVRAYAFTFG